MTIDKSLRIKSGSAKQRNVLSAATRLAKLKEMDRWSEGGKILGLPKVRVLKLSMKKKKKTKAEGKKAPRLHLLPRGSRWQGTRCQSTRRQGTCRKGTCRESCPEKITALRSNWQCRTVVLNCFSANRVSSV